LQEFTESGLTLYNYNSHGKSTQNLDVIIMAETIKQMSVGKFQILSSKRLLANLKYYEADNVNLGFESELKFLSNG